MALGLDLSASHAKVDRAVKHVKALKREARASVPKDGPYSVRFSEIDEQTGWCDVILVPHEGEKPHLGVVLGDVIHNLRSALDYIVTALVDASGAQLTMQHQFPIFIDRRAYRNKVGTAQAAKPGGPLAGIIHGLDIIEQLQPYHSQPNPRSDPLWSIYRFSNADKHREAATFLAEPGGSIQVSNFGDSALLEQEVISQFTSWPPDEECVIHRLRFSRPYPQDLHAEVPTRPDLSFHTSAFGGEPEHAVDIGSFRLVCKYVGMATDLFERL